MESVAAAHPQIDFLSIGHVCYDMVLDGQVAGGAAAYSASVAQALGCRPAIVTSASPEDDWVEELPGIPIHSIAAPATTMFENIDTPTGRDQIIHSVAGRLDCESVPPQWTRAPIVFLGPISNEIDAGIIRQFSDSMIGAGLQGWMRRWDENGRVYAAVWDGAAAILPLLAVVFVSPEDVPHPSIIDEYARLAKILVVTEGPNGCTVYFHGEKRSFPAPKVDAVDTTGAGDIFAAAYLVRLFQTRGDIWEAAEYANRIASRSVTRFGIKAKVDAIRQSLDESLYRGELR